MMKKTSLIKWLAALALLQPLLALALNSDDIKEFGEVFKISAEAPSRDEIEVTWQIADGYYLYNNKFLRFTTDTPGVKLGDPSVPPGEREYDKLLDAEVVKYHHQLKVGLPLLAVPPGTNLVSLRVRSQGCREDVLCYPPTEQLLAVSLPQPAAAPAPAAAASPLSKLLGSSDANENLVQEPGSKPALPPDAAFGVEAIGYSADTILARLTAQPGYYLYRDKLSFKIGDGSGFGVRSVDLPAGTTHPDPEFGPVSVYYGQVDVPVHVYRPAGPEQSVTLTVGYQGCRDGDICYPPQTARIELQMPAGGKIAHRPGAKPAPAPAASGGAARPGPEPEQDRLASLLVTNPAAALLAFFFAGLLLAFTPCVFPMVPILSGIIAGQGERMNAARAFWLSLVYVAAMAVTYTAAGVLAGLFGQNLQAWFQNPWIIGFFIAVFVALALSMFGFYELQLPASLQTRLTRASNEQRGGSLVGVAVMGLLSALIVGPCVAPPLAAALIVIGASGNAVLGGAALFCLALGMGVPLIVFGVSAGRLVPRAGAWMDAVKAVFGVGLLALAVWMLERIVQGPVILLLWGMLAIASGVYMGALGGAAGALSGWQRLWRALGLVLVLVGAIEIVGALSGGNDWTRPLKQLGSAAVARGPEQGNFQRVKSPQDVKAAVARAAEAGKPVMLDFYADWCVECLRMQRNTFPQKDVRGLMARFKLLQADVTGNDAVDRQLLAEYGIIGPPAILFFDRQGKELRNYRLIGYAGPRAFSERLQSMLERP